MSVQYDPFVADVANPHPVYARMREEDPVHYNEMIDAWFLTRFDDVTAVLKDPRFSADRTRSNNFERIRRFRRLPEDAARSMLNSDPPDHTRLRNLVNKAFTARHVEALRPLIQRIVDELLDDAAARGEMEVITELAYPLPIRVIAEVLGVPPSDQERFRAWTGAIAVLLEPFPPDDVLERGMAAQQALREYFTGIIVERRRDPRDDLISALIAVSDGGDTLSTDEMLIMCNLLLIAGHETTVNLIGNGLHALLRHPDELDRLRTDPSLDKPSVEELLRFDGPVGLTGRVATEDVDLHGKPVRKGQGVIALLLAANRDPARFTEPNRLVLDRAPNPHVAFGAGIHFCLGAPLARLEAQICLGTLARRFPRVALGAEPEWRPQFVLRGLRELRVTL